MFLDHIEFVQIISFEIMSQVASLYLVQVLPFDNFQTNFVEIFNEWMIFSIGATCMTLIGRATSVADKETQGDFMTNLLFVKIGFNLVIIIYSTVKALVPICKEKYAKLRLRLKCKSKDKDNTALKKSVQKLKGDSTEDIKHLKQASESESEEESKTAIKPKVRRLMNVPEVEC